MINITMMKGIIGLVIFGMVFAQAGDTLKPSAVFVHPDAAGKLPIIGDVAVVMTGVDQQTNRFLEDALALMLLSESVRVVYPAEKELGKERSAPPEPVKWAKRHGVNCLLTGRVLARLGHRARRRYRDPDKEVRAVSLSLLDVPEDKTLLWALYEPQSEVSLTEIARSFISLMKESLKEEEK